MNHFPSKEYVYMARFYNNPGFYKIGYSKDPLSRINSLCYESGDTPSLVIVGSIGPGKAVYIESQIQWYFIRRTNFWRIFHNNDVDKHYLGVSPQSIEYCKLDSIAFADALRLFRELTIVEYVENNADYRDICSELPLYGSEARESQYDDN